MQCDLRRGGSFSVAGIDYYAFSGSVCGVWRVRVLRSSVACGGGRGGDEPVSLVEHMGI